MEVFIDKDFLLKLFEQFTQQPENDIINEVVAFLSGLTNVKVFANISPDEFRSNILFRKLTNAGETIPIYTPQLKLQLANPQALGCSSYKLFFVEHDEAQNLSSVNGYLFFSSSNLSTLWPTFSNKRDDLEIPIAKEYEKDLLQWNFLQKFAHPIRTILVTDRYMFKSVNRVNDNLIPLLKKLLIKANTPTEIVLIGLFKDKDRQYPITDIYNLIMSTFKISGNIRLFLMDANLSIHSRAVITSYWYINPDTSFDFLFRNSISSSSDGNIYHGFLFRPSKLRLAKQFLKKVKESLQQNTVYFYDAHHQQRILADESRKQLSALQF